MKETGIIMSGNHPKLILDGIKTQTRRVIKPQPFMGGGNASAEHPSYGWFWKKLYQSWEGEEDFFKRLVEQCPYGQVGDRLWVRETWAYQEIEMGSYSDRKVIYKSDNPNEMERENWKPSIHMFRKDSRITLEITEVRVERVQEIDSWDCIHEGIHQKYHSPVYNIITDKPNKRLITDFHNLWDSLNAKRGYGWEVNPWVWVISFKELI